MKKKLLAAARQMANDLYDAGVIDAVTLREYEADCLPVVREFSPREIKRIRLDEKVSQTVFAMYLNTSASTIRQWEQGLKRPRGTSLKLLNLVAKKGLRILKD